MANGDITVTLPAITLPVSIGNGSQAAGSAAPGISGGVLTPGNNAADAPTLRASAQLATKATSTPAVIAQTKSAATEKAALAERVAQLNKYLNDSGRSYQFRVDPQSREQTIQEINPSSGAVIGEFSAVEFPALARSLGVSGLLVDESA